MYFLGIIWNKFYNFVNHSDLVDGLGDLPWLDLLIGVLLLGVVISFEEFV